MTAIVGTSQMHPTKDDTSSTTLEPPALTTQKSWAPATEPQSHHTSHHQRPVSLFCRIDVHPRQSSAGASLPVPDYMQALASEGEVDRRALMQDFETRFTTRLPSLEVALAQRAPTLDVVTDLAVRLSVFEEQSGLQQRMFTAVERNFSLLAQPRFLGAQLPPPAFDGTMSWAAFLVQFESIADINGWTVQNKASLCSSVAPRLNTLSTSGKSSARTMKLWFRRWKPDLATVIFFSSTLHN
ncbi:hypothetical protein HPB51_000189 [Rhipicephalus microplus]|uniref:Uncharacterized protein n=1 Tax=Rhipicephalus microplus TaxID=6941 RepID=A0A9J6D882_RHIMP|nr:hypothetical protein HPB51_000189 [Rhipicephalus microplus]